MTSRGGKKKISKTSRSAKAGVIFPVGRMLRYIKRGLPKYRIGVGAPVYMAAVLEYLTGMMHLTIYIDALHQKPFCPHEALHAWCFQLKSWSWQAMQPETIRRAASHPDTFY